MIEDSIKATYKIVDKFKRQHSFELFGYDFLLDKNCKPYLIEVNTNPCLELSCPLLGRLIPHVIENSFRIVLDSVFPIPTEAGKAHSEGLFCNRFELIFNESVDGCSK